MTTSGCLSEIIRPKNQHEPTWDAPPPSSSGKCKVILGSRTKKKQVLPGRLTCPLKINGWFRCISYWNSPFLVDEFVTVRGWNNPGGDEPASWVPGFASQHVTNIPHLWKRHTRGKWRFETFSSCKCEMLALIPDTQNVWYTVYGVFSYIYHKKSTIHVGKYIPVTWILWIILISAIFFLISLCDAMGWKYLTTTGPKRRSVPPKVHQDRQNCWCNAFSHLEKIIIRKESSDRKPQMMHSWTPRFAKQMVMRLVIGVTICKPGFKHPPTLWYKKCIKNAKNPRLWLSGYPNLDLIQSFPVASILPQKH